jgi:hypothetical protein
MRCHATTPVRPASLHHRYATSRRAITIVLYHAQL